MTKYQIRPFEQLCVCHEENLDVFAAADHFADCGYEYLYVSNGKKIVDVLSYHDFAKYGFSKRSRPYVFDERCLVNETLDDFINTNTIPKRIAFLRADGSAYEVNWFAEPELLHAVERQLLALRYLPTFASAIDKCMEEIGPVLVLGSEETTEFLRKQLPSAKLVFARTARDAAKEIVSFNCPIVDLRYGLKLLKVIANVDERRLFDLYGLIAKSVLQKLSSFARENRILLKLYDIPEYNDIEALSSYENNAYGNKIGFLDLLGDEDYLREFCSTQEDRRFIKLGGTGRSVRSDNGFRAVQNDCDCFGLKVKRGARESIPNKERAKKSVFFFGPCAVFGMMVTDEHTIPSYFARHCLADNIDARVLNYGGLHGNNVLNSLIGAMTAPIKTGDAIVVLDYFRDLECDEGAEVTSVTGAFKNKGSDDTLFFDQPAHCNAKANSALADFMYRDIKEFLLRDDSKETRLDISTCAIGGMNLKQGFIPCTFGSFLKTIGKTKKKMAEKAFHTSGLLGCLFLNDAADAKTFDALTEQSLRRCSNLIVFYSFEHLEFKRQKEMLSLCESACAQNHVAALELPSQLGFSFQDNPAKANEDNVFASMKTEWAGFLMKSLKIQVCFIEKAFADEKALRLFHGMGLKIEIL